LLSIFIVFFQILKLVAQILSFLHNVWNVVK